jgi:hypothetical protein
VLLGFLGAAMVLTQVEGAHAAEPPARVEASYTPPTVQVAKPRSPPSCPRMDMPYLPARTLFERAEGPRQAEAIEAVRAFRDQQLFLERERVVMGPAPPPVPRVPSFERALPGFSLVLGHGSSAVTRSPGGHESTGARLVSAEAGLGVPLPWGRDFRGFVDRHRDLFGIRADRRVRVVEDENATVRLVYPNGALSDGRAYFREVHEGEGTCKLTDIPAGHLIRSDFDADEPYLSSPPAFTAEEALRRFQDIAPYVSTEAEPPVRLVVTPSRIGTARLVWRIRYHYECLSWFAHVGGDLRTVHFNADMDAFSGSLL